MNGWRVSRVVVLGGVAGLVAGLAAAQPPREGAPPPPPPGAADRPEAEGRDREALRARIVRRLEDAKRMQARLERALELFDKGAAHAEVRREMREGGPEPVGAGPRPGERRPPRGMREGDGGWSNSGEAVLRSLDAHEPALAARVREQMTEDPALGRRVVGWVAPRLRELIGERDEELRGLRGAELHEGPAIVEAMRAVVQAASRGEEGESDLSEAKQRLREALGRHYDLRVRIQQREVELLAERLEELRAELAATESRREAALDEQIEALLSQVRERAAGRGRGEGAPAKPDGPR